MPVYVRLALIKWIYLVGKINNHFICRHISGENFSLFSFLTDCTSDEVWTMDLSKGYFNDID